MPGGRENLQISSITMVKENGILPFVRGLNFFGWRGGVEENRYRWQGKGGEGKLGKEEEGNGKGEGKQGDRRG